MFLRVVRYYFILYVSIINNIELLYYNYLDSHKKIDAQKHPEKNVFIPKVKITDYQVAGPSKHSSLKRPIESSKNVSIDESLKFPTTSSHISQEMVKTKLKKGDRKLS